MIGTRLSRYKIEEQIGAGGMGVVYRAHDERLGRDVALKVLPTGALVDEVARKRFRKEALTLSQLNHPSIATIYDFDSADGIEFLVMELIPGESLDQKLAAGPLPEKDVVHFGLQMVQGLVVAHQHGIIHRDLKPSNLRVTPDQRVKILDFGVAQLVRTGDWNATLSTTSAPGAGTVPYMAPEQLRDEIADPRTDVYSTGAVLYELATGRRPFPEKQGPRLIDAILHHQPPAPRDLNKRISPGLDLVIQKAMDKDPEHRYQSARELQVDLERLSTPTQVGLLAEKPHRSAARRMGQVVALVGAMVLLAVALDVGRMRTRWGASGGPAQIESLAVLPLENLSGDAGQDYFADGITDALVNELTRIRALRVISRWSVMRYKGTQKTLREIAKELNVDGIVVGSVLRVNNRVEVRVQLNHPASDANLWANRYEGELRDVLSLQKQLVGQIVQEMHVQLTAQEQTHLAQRREVNPEALDAYLQGRFHWNKRTEEGFLTALKSFELAIQKDPQYAQGYAGLADTYALLGGGRYMSPSVAKPRMKEAALKALSLDPTLAEPYAALHSLYYDTADLAGAERELKRALELNPGHATAHHWYAWTLAAAGQFEAAFEQIRLAQEREPFSLIIRTNVGFLRYMAGQYDKAIALCQATLMLDPNYPAARECVAQSYLEIGRYEEAVRQLRDVPNVEQAELGYALAVAGYQAEARQLLAKLQERARYGHVSPYEFAIIYTGLDERDAAFEWLEKAWQQTDSRLVTIKVHPRYKKLRSDPRFAALLRKMRLAP
jgi:TolB-like protein